MQTSVEAPPEAPSLPRSRPVRKRRLRRWLIGAAIVVLATAGIAGSAYLANYDPICQANCSGSFGYFGPGVKDLGTSFPPGGSSFEAYRGVAHSGSTFTEYITLSNQGPFSVTVVAIATPNLWGPRLRIRGVTTSPTTGPAPKRTAFRPFTLHPQESLDVQVTIQLTGCLTNSESLIPSGIPVTFRVLGFTHRMTVDGNATIQLVRDPSVACR